MAGGSFQVEIKTMPTNTNSIIFSSPFSSIFILHQAMTNNNNNNNNSILNQIIMSDDDYSYNTDDDENFEDSYQFEDEHDPVAHAEEAKRQSKRRDNGTSIDMYDALQPMVAAGIFSNEIPLSNIADEEEVHTPLPNNMFENASVSLRNAPQWIKDLLRKWGRISQPNITYETDSLLQQLDCTKEELIAGSTDTAFLVKILELPAILKSQTIAFGDNSLRKRIGGDNSLFTCIKPGQPGKLHRSDVFFTLAYTPSTCGPWGDIRIANDPEGKRLKELLDLAHYLSHRSQRTMVYDSSDILIAICDCIGVHTSMGHANASLLKAVGGSSNLLTIDNIRQAGPNGLEWRKVNNDTPAFKIKLCTVDGDDLDQLIASALSVEDATAELARIRDLAYSFCASSTLYILSEEDMSGRMVPVLKYNSLNNLRTGPLRTAWKQNKRTVNLTKQMILDAMETNPRGRQDNNGVPYNSRLYNSNDRDNNLRWVTTVDQTTYDNTDVPENVRRTSPILHNLLYGEGLTNDEL